MGLKMLLRPRGMSLEEKAPELLFSPGLLIPAPGLLPIPPSRTTKTLAHKARYHHEWEQMEAAVTAQGGCHQAHSPLEFWELLFVSSKWFCALLSTLRLKALSAGWGTGESKRK